MKVKMDDQGRLTVWPESDTEIYALHCMCQEEDWKNTITVMAIREMDTK